MAGTILGFQHIRRQVQLDELKRSIPDIDEKHAADKLTDYGAAAEAPITMTHEDDRGALLASRARLGDYDEELIKEQLARNYVFLKDDGMTKLRAAFVIVVGCGGVGSHATVALARSGVSKLRLIDFDQVGLSSLNRHAVATLADVGTPKVHCIRKRLEQVTPWTHFDCRNELFRADASDALLANWTPGEQRPDYVIDAIDNIDTKVALLSYCHQKQIRVVSSMGAGCKSDPSRIFIGDISTSLEDGLSRSTRRRLRLMGVAKGIPVVYSSEKPGPGKAQLLPLPDDEFEKGRVGELSVLPDFRVRILPVLGTMPAIFGYTAANHVILDIAGYPHEYVTAKGRDKMHDGILTNLQGCEERLAAATLRGEGKALAEDTIDGGLGVKVPITKEDVAFLVEEIYRGKSVISGLSTRLALIRWQRAPSKTTSIQPTPKPSSSASPSARQPASDASSEMFNLRYFPNQISSNIALGDLVCMTKEEAAEHERGVLKAKMEPESLYRPDTLRLVESRRREVQDLEGIR